jgi:serine-type D-Ala-D-Ala carboxypeptidase/endopeptidase (penicillin-binding protein 4)
MRGITPFRLFCVCWALASAPCLAGPKALPQEVSQSLARAGVDLSSISVLVQALPDGRNRSGTSNTSQAGLPAPVIEHRADAAVHPASVMKLITTYAALDQLGADFMWINRVYVDGTVSQGVLHGNLVIRGSGDPKLVLERIEDLFKQILAQGVREVRGDMVLDRSVFHLGEHNPADFDDEPLRPYNAAPDGLLLNFKSLVLRFVPDATGKRVELRSEPPIAGVVIPSEIPSSPGRCGDWRSSLQADFSNPDQIKFAGHYPLACGERIWPVAYLWPEQYAPRVLEAMWRHAGGQLSGRVREGALPRSAHLLLSAQSLPLSAIVADINKFSNNVMAQQLFLTLSSQLPQLGRAGSFADSRQQLRSWWQARLPRQAQPVIDNGSGLSRKERASAAAINALLQHAAASPLAQVFADSLGIAGVDGTVARMRERSGASAAIGQAQLKTGTLKDVAAVAGYATAQNGQRYSLVAIINHPHAAAARPALDALVEWVVKQR